MELPVLWWMFHVKPLEKFQRTQGICMIPSTWVHTMELKALQMLLLRFTMSVFNWFGAALYHYLGRFYWCLTLCPEHLVEAKDRSLVLPPPSPGTDRLDDPVLAPSPQVQSDRLVVPRFTGPHTHGLPVGIQAHIIFFAHLFYFSSIICFKPFKDNW